MAELKPCPFCGGEAMFEGTDGTWIVCMECGAETAYLDTREKAIEAWSGRVSNDRT